MKIPLYSLDEEHLAPLYNVDNSVPSHVNNRFKVINVHKLEPKLQPYLAWVQGEPVIIAPDSKLKPIRAEWQRMTGKWRSSDPLLKAVKHHAHNVVDLSAGLGGDAGLLAAAGYSVTVVERNPILAALLALSLVRKSAMELPTWFKNINAVYQMDALEFLDRFGTRDSIYFFDPMYPSSSKKRLTRGAMQVIQHLEKPNDNEARAVIRKAQVTTDHRVVVKRPPKAPKLIDQLSHSIDSKNVRFDVYRPVYI